VTSEQVWLTVASAVALAGLLLALLAARRARRAETLAAGLAERVALLESPATDAPETDAAESAAYVITDLEPRHIDRDEHVPVAVPIDGRLFADIVARETVVRAASWTAGLRRALAPETRNRIRFHVRQETRQAGRERRAETKQALREFRARERAAGAHRSGAGEDVA
jgi:hypothetical protein